jgi:hypothetical protein
LVWVVADEGAVTAFLLVWMADIAVTVGLEVVGAVTAPVGDAVLTLVTTQLAVTLWTDCVPGGSMSIGGVPAGALAVEVTVVPLSRTAVTVHWSAEAAGTARPAMTTRAQPIAARRTFTSVQQMPTGIP